MRAPPATRSLAALVAGMLVVALSATAFAQAPPRPPKACAAARNHVTQQRKALADIDQRIEREQRSRFACGSKKACRRFDQRIESLQKRRDEHALRLSKLEAAEAKACAAPLP